MKTHPWIYKKNKNTNFREPVFELLSAMAIWDSAEALLPWSPRV